MVLIKLGCQMSISISCTFNIEAAKVALENVRRMFWNLAYRASTTKLSVTKGECKFYCPELSRLTDAARTKSQWCDIAREYITKLETEINTAEALQTQATIQTRGTDVEVAHSEALKMNELFDDAPALQALGEATVNGNRYYTPKYSNFWWLAPEQRDEWLSNDHAEALEMNAAREQLTIRERAARAARYSAAWVGVVSPQQLNRFVEVANNRPAGYDPHSIRVTVTAACKELISRTQWSA